MAREQALVGPSTQPTPGPWSCPHSQCQGQQTPAETALRHRVAAAHRAWVQMGSGKCCPNQPNTAPQRRPAEGEGLSPGPQVVASDGHDPGRAEGSGPRVSRQHVEPRSSQEHSALVPTRSVWAPALDAPIQGHCGCETGHHTATSHQETFPPSPNSPAPPTWFRPEPCCAPLPGTPSHGRSSSTQSEF